VEQIVDHLVQYALVPLGDNANVTPAAVADRVLRGDDALGEALVTQEPFSGYLEDLPIAALTSVLLASAARALHGWLPSAERLGIGELQNASREMNRMLPRRELPVPSLAMGIAWNGLLMRRFPTTATLARGQDAQAEEQILDYGRDAMVAGAWFFAGMVNDFTQS
jgi:hypothetical protein